MKIIDIARICHEANRALCETQNDHSQVEWGNAPEWQRDSAVKGVLFRLENLQSHPGLNHAQWMRDKLADGWKYGPEKDPAKKEHPCMVPYNQLPPEQKAKDALFTSIVDALQPYIEEP